MRFSLMGMVTLAAAAAAGADWTVADTQTLTHVTNVYDTVTVSGNLTVGAGAKLQCATKLVVSGAAGATLTVQDGGYVEVNGTAYFAKAGGKAQITVAANSKIAVGGDVYLAYGYDAAPASTDPKAYCRIDVNGVVNFQNMLYAGKGHMVPYPGQYTDWNAAVPDVDADIWLNAGGEFQFHKFSKEKPSNDSSDKTTCGRTLQQCFHFNGGRVVQTTENWGPLFVIQWSSGTQAYVRLVSESGNDIEFSLKTVKQFFMTHSTTATFTLEGNGDFVKDGASTTALSVYGDESSIGNYDNWNTQSYGIGKVSRRNFTGAIRVKGGTLQSYRTSDWCDNAAPVRKIIVEPGGTFDFNGSDISVTEFQAHGLLANSSATVSTLTLNTGAGDVSVYSLCPNLNIVDNGTGTLSACVDQTGPGTLTKNAGTLALKSRREFGYNFYRFRTRGARDVGVVNGQIRIREFYYLDGDTDVTAGYDSYVHIPRWTSYYTLAPAMWDRNLATFYKDQQAQNASAMNWLYFTVGFKPARKVTGYKWNAERVESCPTNWVFLANRSDNLDNYNNNGSDDGWTVLDTRCDDSVKANSETPKYEIAYPAESAMTVSNVTLANGATLNVAGADLTLSAATLAGATVRAGFGATLTLPAGASETALEIDASADGAAKIVNFNPAATGTVRVRNWSRGNPHKLPLELENLGSEANLAAWPVYFDDETTPSRYRIYLEAGHARLRSSGLSIIFR